jgi:hypothetical protein
MHDARNLKTRPPVAEWRPRRYSEWSGDQIKRSRSGGARLACAGSTGAASRDDADARNSAAGPLGVSEFPELRFPPDMGFLESATTFASERRDPVWSTQMEGRILDRISQSGFAATTMQVNCHETICCVIITYPPGADVSFATIDQFSFEGLEFKEGAPAFFGFLERMPVRIMYLFRNDETMP